MPAVGRLWPSDDNGGRGDRWSAQISICLPASRALKQHFPKLKIQNVTFVDRLTWFMQTILYDFINLRSHTTLHNQWNSTRNWDLRAPFRKKGNCLTLTVDWLFWYNGTFVSFNEVISQRGISCTPQTKEREVWWTIVYFYRLGALFMKSSPQHLPLPPGAS